MRLIIAAEHETDVEAALTADPRAGAPLRLWRERPGAWDVVRGVLDHADHAATAEAGDPVRRWAETFDRVASVSPEAAVALYSLGDAALLEAAGGEIVGWLDSRGLLDPATTVIDLGCGMGRVARLLAPRVDAVLGLDVSRRLLRHARAVAQDAPNLLFALHAGRDLACVRDGAADLVLAVDVMPYLVSAGLAAAHVADAFRALRPGGALVVMNWSYRGDPDLDLQEAEAAAAAAGFTRGACVRPFSLWDGRVFHWARPR
nr:class I SAM-dependent methyltransferase [Alsobacter ponti]